MPLPSNSITRFVSPSGVSPFGFSGVIAAWTLIVILPLLGLVLWSFLKLENFQLVWEPNLQAYRDLLSSGRWEVTIRTLRIAAVVTAIELALAVPFAVWLAKGTRSTPVKVVTLAALTIPFFLSISARTIVWRAVLGLNGPVNAFLMTIGFTDRPLDWLLFSEFAVIVGLIGPYFPPMVFPLYLAVSLIDDELLAASKDLGASPAFTFWHVILPLALPGLGAGFIFTFIPMIGDPVVPELLGGGQVVVLASSVKSLLQVLNYTVAAALSVFMLAIMAGLAALLALMLGGRLKQRRQARKAPK
ncbi:ABC transporter permease [Taklimakanibacter deserti]|uniref:ABC transporter permease n=1 Tax=Taklimakanibacter deserti TaxID=2267839 RepID=UPI000E646589